MNPSYGEPSFAGANALTIGIERLCDTGPCASLRAAALAPKSPRCKSCDDTGFVVRAVHPLIIGEPCHTACQIRAGSGRSR